MPRNHLDDSRDRFRSAQPHQSIRPRLEMDVRAPGRQNFPPLGVSLPPQRLAPQSAERSLPSQKPPIRARAAWATPAAANVSSPPLVRPTPSAKKKRRILSKWRAVVITLILLVLLGGWLGTKLLSNTLKIFKGNVFGILSTTQLKGEDTGRVNLLLAGNSADDPGHDGANLTDSIMVVSIDVQHNSAFILSIPRDLWVEIPGYGHAKINEAYVDGEAGHFSNSGYPNGGMGLLEEVIHDNFDLPINYYALIDYNALKDGVNAVGGIDLTIKSSDPRGLYDPSIDWSTHGPLVKLTNGVHHLNGEQALDLARARGDAYGSYGFPRSDFDRTQNQRVMMLALKNKVLTAGILANPIALGSLFDSLGKNVKTDMTLSEARRAYDLGKGIDNSKIVSAGLNDANGKNLLANFRSPNGESALVPAAGIDNFGQIQAYIRYLTTGDPVARENESLESAQNRLKDIYAFAALRHQPIVQPRTMVDLHFTQRLRQVTDLMENDFRTPELMALNIFGTDSSDSTDKSQSHIMNGIPEDELHAFSSYLQALEDYLGLGLMTVPDISPSQKHILKSRDAARRKKDWSVSDELRAQLEAEGIGLRDTAAGALWYWL